MKRISKFVLILSLALFLPFAPSLLGDGFDQLGPPSIPIATGTDIILAGKGLISQPGVISINIPAGATIKQVLLYWDGRSGNRGNPFVNDPGPTDVILLDGVPISGDRISQIPPAVAAPPPAPPPANPAGGAVPFGTFPSSSSYRKDITDLVEAGTIPMTVGVVNNYTASGLDFNWANDGAALVVILEDGSGSSIELFDGTDVAVTQPGPQVGVLFAVPLTYTFPAAAQDRQGDLFNVVADAQEADDEMNTVRANALSIKIGDAEPIILVDPFFSADSPRWDTHEYSFTIPAGVTSVTVQPLSEDFNEPPLPTIPSSLTWVVSTLRICEALKMTGPPDITLGCNPPEIPVCDVSLVTATSPCCLPVNIACASVDTVTNQAGCLIHTRLLTYTATDRCGNQETFVQRITWTEDMTPPVLVGCPPDITVECDVFETMPPPEIAAMDNCDPAPALGAISSISQGDCPQSFVVSRRWFATDACGNEASCSQRVTVVDTTPPVLTCPPDITVECDVFETMPPPVIGVTDNCDPEPALAAISNISQGDCPQSSVISRSWSATDACGNVASCSQRVTVVDTTPPVLIGCPPDITVECDVFQTMPAPVITATDNCDPEPALAAISNISQGACPQNFVISRRWFATDACGNEASCSQTVTVVDTTPPVFTLCPPDVMLGCVEPDNMPGCNLSQVAATDACGPVMITCQSVDSTVGCRRTRTLTYTATDECQNKATCVQEITFLDDNAPPNIVCEEDFEVECNTDWVFDMPSGADDCDGFTIEVVSTVTNLPAQRCPIVFSVTRTWRAVDLCGNEAFCSQTATLVDIHPPNINCEEDFSVECGSDWVFDIPTAVDKCDGLNVLLEVTGTVTNVASPRCPQVRSVTRTWRATDSCGNAAFCSQTVTVLDTTAPHITCADDQIVECGNPFAFLPPTAVDACDGTNVTILMVGTVTNVANPQCPEKFTAIRTWQASDSCGNSSFCHQIITVIDTTPPNITCSDDQIVECGNPFGFLPPTAVDACDGVNVVVEVISTVTNLANPQCPEKFTAVRTWQASDSCGNASFCRQTITVIDTTPPNITCADNQILECGIPIGFLPPTAVDACDGINVVVEMVSTVTNVANPRCPELFTVVRTMRATDTCGNASLCTQTLTVVDTMAPSVVCAEDRIVQCGVPWNFTPPAATDICSAGNVTVEMVGTVTNSACGGTLSATRTWRVTDQCGNSAQCSQSVLVVDTRPPDLFCANDRVVECGTPFSFNPPSATDICAGPVTPVILSTVTNALCGKTFAATRTWTATDQCGNTATCSQTVTVLDTRPPTLSCAGNRVLECGTPWTFSPPSAIDACDGAVTPVVVSTVTNALCGQTFTATRTWEATDLCGNKAVCSQTVSLVDTVAPVLVGIPTYPLPFLCMANVPPPPTVTGFDSCDPNVPVTFQETTSGSCPTIITRCWTAKDACNNSVTECQFLLVQPRPPVLLSSPTDKMVCPGESAQFCVQVSSACPVTYQWTRNGVPIPGATGECLQLANVTLADAGEYCARVLGECHALTNCAKLVVLTNTAVTVSAPVCIKRGSSVEICPTITGTGPFTCVWTRNGGVISSECCLKINNYSESQSGEYTLSVTGRCNTDTETINLCPIIDAQSIPITQLNEPQPCLGGPVKLCTTLYDNPCVTYQWYKNSPTAGNEIPGATGACVDTSLTVSPTVFYVVARGGCGATNSIPLGCQPNICLTKNATRSTAAPGGSITYVYVVNNCGAIPLVDVDIVDDNATPNNPGDDFVVATGVSLAVGESQEFTATIQAPDCRGSGQNGGTTTKCTPATFEFTGSSSTSGTAGNTRTFSAGGVTVRASAFSRTDNGDWDTAYLGSYGSGLGVTDGSEGDGGNNTHTVDNVSRFNYVLFEFSESIVATEAFLDNVINDSDARVWVGTFADPFNSHLTLSDAVLNNFALSEDSPSSNDDSRWAVFNGGQITGNAVVIAALPEGSRNDRFKIRRMRVCKPEGPPAPCDTCITNVAVATGVGNTLTGPVVVRASDDAVVCLTDEPMVCIDVVKEIACLLPGDQCGPFSKVASGVAGDHDVGFCYSITVRNCGDVALTDLSVLDDKLGDLTSVFFGGAGATLPAGGSINRVVKMAWAVDTTNTVVASGRSPAPNSRRVSDEDSAVALVQKAQLACLVLATSPCDQDGSSTDNHVQLPGDGSACPVTFTVVVCNLSAVNFTDVTISQPGLAGVCATPVMVGAMPVGTCVTNICTVMLTCNDAPIVNEVMVRGHVDPADHCTYDFAGEPIMHTFTCVASVDCGTPPCFELTKTAGAPTTTTCVASTFEFNGNSSTSGSAGNIRTFSAGGVTVKASAFSRTDNGNWETAYLGSYSSGLGVTDGSEGNGGSNKHVVDNVDRFNYVLFEFSEPIVATEAFLDNVISDSDARIWVGTFADPFNTHLTLSDALLSSFALSEDSAASNGNSRWAAFNGGQITGNALVIAALPSGSRNDQFKIRKLRICKPDVGVGMVDLTKPVTYTYTARNCGGTVLTDITVSDDNGTPDVLSDDFVVGVIPSLAPGAAAELSRTVTLPVRVCDSETGLESGLLITEILPNGNIQVSFIQDFGVNDNTYGVNTIGWGGSGKHKLSNLLGSDKAEFEFTDGGGSVVLKFTQDYISEITSTAQFPAGYRSLGVSGGEGKVETGSASSVLAWSTSLEENLNKAPFLNNLSRYEVDSPALSDPNSDQWEYRMIYTVVISRNAFGAAGFGSVMITDQHNSPKKRDVKTPVACTSCVTNIAKGIAIAGSTTLSATASAIVCPDRTPPPPGGGDCPEKADFWKKNTSAWVGYSPNQTVGSVFAKASRYSDTANKSLAQAIDKKGSSNKEVKELLVEAVAGLLNAARPGVTYAFTEADIIEGVNMVLMGGKKDDIKSLQKLLKEANDDKNCGKSDGGDDCDTAGKPNVLTLRYNGQSCAQAMNSQREGKTSCSGDPQGAASVRIVASSSSSPPSSGSFFNGVVSLGQQFEVRPGGDKFGSNTYFHIFNGSTLVQTIQMHTSCSAPLRRGESFGALVLVDYRIE